MGKDIPDCLILLSKMHWRYFGALEWLDSSFFCIEEKYLLVMYLFLVWGNYKESCYNVF